MLCRFRSEAIGASSRDAPISPPPGNRNDAMRQDREMRSSVCKVSRYIYRVCYGGGSQARR